MAEDNNNHKALSDTIPKSQLLGHVISDIRVVEARFEELDALLHSGCISPEHIETIRRHSDRLKVTRIMLLRTLIYLNRLTGLEPYWSM